VETLEVVGLAQENSGTTAGVIRQCELTLAICTLGTRLQEHKHKERPRHKRRKEEKERDKEENEE
jgi:hypothetical protein